MTEQGHLKLDEPHPSARIALEWIRQQPPFETLRWVESFASCAISGKNRLAEICSETLRRLMHGEPVSDRYLMGLYIAMRYDHADITKKRRKANDKSTDGSFSPTGD